MTVNEISEMLISRDIVFNVFSHVFLDVPDEHSDGLLAKGIPLLALIAESSTESSLISGIKMMTEAGGTSSRDISDWLETSRLDRARHIHLWLCLGWACLFK